ncbi:MAPEG family protein [Aquamicrobium sp. LC103]|uniref:MAPEG family protein n=1 Tax=Aquamicrobium sp. LC103 TaxID=1120658 RepID=UPI00063EC613|nr:MAPEG family protein [Aquamicrobium sp. LC103]TKT80977.1 hypothetical protein XW59_003600 [Aquamicrobium sp. LC103]
MNQIAIFWPMIAHVLLVYIIYALMFFARRKAVRVGSAKISQFRENRNEPPESLFIRNNLANQFELPVLFHAVCLALYATSGAGFLAVVLAWIFVAMRYVHAAIHVTSNRILHRQLAFSLGTFVLGVMWILLAVHLLQIA